MCTTAMSARGGALGDRAGDLADRDEGGDGARTDRLAALVHDEAAVGVTVEGEADVGAVLDHSGLEVDEVLRLERVGLMVGEGAVELEIQRDHLERQGFQPRRSSKDGRRGMATHPVAGVDDDLERADTAQVHERAEEGGVVRQQVALDDRADGRLLRSGPRHGNIVSTIEDPLGEVTDLREPAALADRPRPRAAELDAVVLRGVVARREHRARQVECAARVVEPVGRAEADEGDVEAVCGDPLGEGLAEGRRARPHVGADDDAGGPLGEGDDLGEGRADGAGDVVVELVGHDTSDVVGPDEVLQAVRRSHGATLSGGPGTDPRCAKVQPNGRGWVQQPGSARSGEAAQRSRNIRRWPRRPTSTVPASASSDGVVGVPAAPGAAAGRGAPERGGRPASRTASARASRSSLEGGGGVQSPLRRTTSQPRGAVIRSAWTPQRS